MSKKLSAAFLSFFLIAMFGCVGLSKKNALPVPPPSTDKAAFFDAIEIGNILESKGGYGNKNLPDWLAAYIYGGIEEIERMDFYRGRYCFIGRNDGNNFGALCKWIDNYSPVQDFTRLAAARIENRLITAASLYPDDEYGSFYEKLVKKAFDTEYPDALIEDTYWIRKIKDGESGGETFEFFVFITIDKAAMQDIIIRMIAETLSSAAPTRAQMTAINRLRQNFFEGF